jgi:hypothetical protein
MGNSESGDYTQDGAKIIKNLIPYFIGLGGLVCGIWAMSNNQSQIAATEVYQGQEINQLVKAETDEQTISVSIQTQLAQLQQSVADIKVNTAHGE